MSEVKDNTEEKIIGKFKTSRNYENFVSGLRNSKVRLLRDEAFLDGGVLSGMLEGVKLKLTIRDKGTVDLEEVSDTNITDDAMLQRLVEQIDDLETNHYAEKSIISSLTFKDKNNDICYLCVEYETPMNRLNSLFEEDDKKIEMSKSSRSALDMLLSSDEFQIEDEEESIDEEDENIEVENNDEVENTYHSTIKESFEASKKEKLEELQNRIKSYVQDINRYKNEKNVLENKIEETSEGLSILEKRLDSMGEKQEPNGMVFFVSEEQKEDIGLTEDHREIVGKISDLIGLKKDALYKQLTEGYFLIKVGNAENLEDKNFVMDNEALELIKAIDFSGNFSTSDKRTIKYQGKLNWHQLVSNMIRLGFVQDEKFDKLSGSNSYKINEEKE